MTSRIRVLPAELADQIAAGEVVERPASVVKELVENALDAGARRVDIEIERGGLGLITVTDDGSGMSPEEAHLALKRHATSKLREFADLHTLSSMGFRGEALPSIAAVSRLTLTTRAVDAPPDQGAYQLEVHGGIAGEGRHVGAPTGTRIEVRDLCANVPARLKFMKAPATESAHVAEAVLRLALAFPAVHFRLRSEGRSSQDLPPHPSGFERAKVALGRSSRAPARLHLAAGEENGVTVEAYLGSPAESMSTSRGAYLFVNRRFVRDRSLLHALSMGYGETLERGRYPLAVVHLALPGDAVDVNVHPQKLEVRFAHAPEVYAAVRHVLRAAVGEAPWLTEPPGAAVTVYSLPPARANLAAAREPRLGYEERRRRAEEAMRMFAPPMESLFRAPPPPPVPEYLRNLGVPADASASPRPADAPEWPAGGEAASRAAQAGANGPGDAGGPLDAGPLANGPLGAGRRGEPSAAMDVSTSNGGPSIRTLVQNGEQPSNDGPSFRTPVRSEHAPPPIDATDRFFSSLLYLGQLHRTYLICQAPGELVLIDQHAAHERVAFQRLREAYARRGVRSQRLLLPTTLDLEPRLLAMASEHAALLESLGFELAAFGEHTLAVRALPEALGNADPAEAVGEVLAELEARDATELISERLDHVLATIACHSVVRAGDTLGEREVRALLESMDGIDYRAHCPHGRPVLLRLSLSEIERRFGRT